MLRRYAIGFVLLLVISVLTTAQAGEFRSVLVDAWYWGSGYGIVNPAATQDTVNRVKAWNCNVVLMQVRKRSDAYYSSALEPRGTDPSPDPGYDPLADMVAKAHAAGLEVHTWMVPYRVWTTAAPPPHSTPEHVYYLHPEWFSRYSNGDILYDGRYTSLDPGVPAVEDYLEGVFVDMVQRYDIDGVLLDYIRYYSTDWGYNPTAVARFNAEYGRTGTPSSTDAVWCQWRRDQVSNLVKRLYLEIKAVKPHVKVGALVWKTAASGYSDVLQDWDRWMANHWLDYASPMNYTSDNPTFHTNSLDSLARGYGHHVYMGVDGEMNTVSGSTWQIQDARAAGFPGMHLYSYAACNSGTPDQEALKNALLAGPYPTQAAVPAMAWLTSPTKGYLKGFIRDAGTAPIYPATVTVLGPGTTTKNSGTGFYGFSEVAPGDYTVRVESPGCLTAERSVTITAGHVSSLDFSLQRDPAAPAITDPHAESIQGTNAQIKWVTDKSCSSQVDYGMAAGYGTTTNEDTALVTSHVVQLTGLRPFTLYHFRVRSFDAARNVVQSADGTFTTATHDLVSDIVIDNQDSRCRTYGTWWTGAVTGRYGADYFYTTTTDPNRYTLFTPSILTPGPYDVYIWYTQGSNRSTQAKWRVYYDGGMQEYSVNEQFNGGRWILLASDKPFACGTSGYVGTYSSTGDTSTMSIIADAVKFVFKGNALAPIAQTIAEAKTRPDDGFVVLLGKVVSAGLGDHFYICEGKQDQVSGIRVNGAAPSEGSSVDLSGVLGTLDGERVLGLPYLQSQTGPGVPRPLFMLGRDVGGGRLNSETDGVTDGTGVNNIGLLITTAGRVTYSTAGYFYADDGSGAHDDSPHAGIKVLGSVPVEAGTDPVGKYVIIKGISCCSEASNALYHQIWATEVTVKD